MDAGTLALLLLAAFFGLLAAVEVLDGRRRHRSDKDSSARTLTNFGLGMLAMLAGAAPSLFRIDAGAIGAANGIGWAGRVALGWPAMFMATLLARSMIAYWVHRLWHAVPLLWRVHRVHHTDELLDISTGLRNHPLELLVALPTSAIPVLLLGTPPSAVIAVDAILFAAALWQHAAITLPEKSDRILGVAFVTPAFHRAHHAPDRCFHDTNYGDLLTCWDRLFGTFTPALRSCERVGLHPQRARPDSLIEQLVSPFHPLGSARGAEAAAGQSR